MSISREVLAKYIKPGCTFIETGTRWGDTCIKAVELGAEFAVSCESDQLMATIASMHCHDVVGDSAHVVNADSITFLGWHGYESRDNHSKTVVFLDAHSDTSSPIIKELSEIKHKWRSQPGTILIDDLRCMTGWGVAKSALQAILEMMGYKVTYENGVEANDIMVGTRS